MGDRKMKLADEIIELYEKWYMENRQDEFCCKDEYINNIENCIGYDDFLDELKGVL
jgi:hypothetical protein